ncbi:iron-containing alcohol dehydrogenase [Caldithrix abyssi]|nr:iron-containing alcohol dehydrogenase [Caldithrix abyssi]
MAQIEHFSINTNTLFGVNCTYNVPILLQKYGYNNIGIIIDETVAKLPVIDSRLTEWQRKGLKLKKVFHSRSKMEPDYDYLDKIVEEFRLCEYDAIIGIGGGSTLDLAKGVGILLMNPGHGIDYRGMDKVKAPGVPVVLIPTTAGTGSEVTQTASFIDNNDKTKLGINGKYVDCFMSFLDPSIIIGCPPAVTLSSGLDALVHAIEAVTVEDANQVALLFGIEAVKLLFKGLSIAIDQPSCLEGRADTFLGSHYAGIAMWNAQGGPASGISYPLGVHYGVPHGFAGGILLPHVVSINIEKGYVHGYARIYERLDCSNPKHNNDTFKASGFRDRLFNLYELLGVPKTYAQWGVGSDAINFLVERTMVERKESVEKNPVPFEESDVLRLIKVVTEGK